MATTTSNLSLRKPESSDFVSVALDIAANMQTVDDKWATSVAADIGAAAAAGSALTVARTDHVHKVGSGTVSAPGLPIGESNSGFYRIGSANIGAAISGALSWAYSATGIAIETALALKHVASVTATSGYVKLFAKSDENLYKHTGAGDEVRMLDADIFTAAGDLVYGTGAETFTQRALGTKGYALLAGASAPTYEPIDRKNRLINGDMRVCQRATMPTADNSYALDGMRILLGAANAATVSQETSDLPSGGSRGAVKMTVGSANNNKFGVFLPVVGQDMWDLRGQAVSVQCRIKTTSAIGDIRMALVQWTGTEDSISADPISAWGSAGTNPTYTGSWANVNTPANLSPTTSWATYKLENQSVSSSATDLAVFIWCDDTGTTQTTDYMLITGIQLERGTICTEVERLPFSQQLDNCHHWLQAYGGVSNTLGFQCIGQSSSTTLAEFGRFVFRPMRVAPSLSITNADWAVYVQASPQALSATTLLHAEPTAIWLRATTSSAVQTAGHAVAFAPQISGNGGSFTKMLLIAEP